MHGIDVETAKNGGPGGVLEPSEGRLRLVQISDGKETDVYDVFEDNPDVMIDMRVCGCVFGVGSHSFTLHIYPTL
jgi:hypothetical protein